MTEGRSRLEETKEFWQGRKTLITGGLGFIGSNLARRLVDLGSDVLLLDSLVPGHGGLRHNVAEISDRVQVQISDLRDVDQLTGAVRGQEVIFNLAGQTSHMASMTDPVTDLEVNSAAQLYLLEACRREAPDARLVFAGTRQIYGKPDYLPVDEAHPLRPVDVNGINKLAGELYHVLYNNVYGLKATVLRLTNTYGPRMRIKDAGQTFLGMWIRLVLEKRPFEVWGGAQLRDFTYVNDLIDALLLSVTVPTVHGRVFNIGGFPPIDLKGLAALLTEIDPGAGYVVKPFPADRQAIDIGDYYADHAAFHSATGWTPRVDLREGLAQTLHYFRDNLGLYR